MTSNYSSLLSYNRKCFVYVPWISLISLLIVLAGTIVWGVGTSEAVKNTELMLDALRIDLDFELRKGQTVASWVIAGCCVLAGGMLAMSSGRSCTEYAVDQKGAPTRGSPYWLAGSAIVTVLWWLLLVLLMFVFFICILWWALMYGAANTLEVAADVADMFVQAGIDNQASIDAIVEQQFGELPDYYMPTSDCPFNCFNVLLMQYFTGRSACVCSGDVLRNADKYAWLGLEASVNVVVGCFIVWVGSSFLLMNATADFAQARRERALLLRVKQGTLTAAGATADGGGGGGGAKAFALPSDAPQHLYPQPFPPTQAEVQQPQLQQVGVAGGTGLELTSMPYGVQQMPYGEPGYADGDKVPLLKEAQQQQPYQQQQQYPPQAYNPYIQVQPQVYGGQVYDYQNQPPPVVLVTAQSEPRGDNGR